MCAVKTALIGECSAMQEWSLLVAPAVLGTISIFVVVLARVESWLFEWGRVAGGERIISRLETLSIHV